MPSWLARYLVKRSVWVVVTFVIGLLLAFAGGARAAGAELAYAERTTATSVTATTEGTANTVVTAAGVPVDGSTPLLVEFFAPFVQPDSAAGARIVRLYLFEGSTSLGEWANVLTDAPDADSWRWPVHLVRRLTPASGTRTYSVRAATNTGTAVVHGGAGGSGGARVPAFVRVSLAEGVPAGDELGCGMVASPAPSASADPSYRPCHVVIDHGGDLHDDGRLAVFSVVTLGGLLAFSAGVLVVTNALRRP